MLLSYKKNTTTVRIDYFAETEYLRTHGWLTNTNGLTAKAELALQKIDDILTGVKTVQKKRALGEEADAKIAEYRLLFPAGTIPSGSQARTNVKELEKKFLWFFANYQYDWDTIIKATKKYIEKYEGQQWLYMKTSSFFISKPDKSGTITSELATYCDAITSGDMEEEQYVPTNIRR